MERRSDIYAIVESFIRENLSSKYSDEELEQLVDQARQIVREKLEGIPKEGSRSGTSRRQTPPQPDLEEKLRQSLREKLKGGEEVQ